MTVRGAPETTADGGRRKRYSRAERERQILAVAEEVFANEGYQSTSMDDIAQRVGLSKPMLYEYFGSKDGLLLASLERAARELHDCTTRAATSAAGAGASQLIHDCLLAFFQFGDDHAQAWALLRHESALPLNAVNSGLEAIRRQQIQFTAEVLGGARPDLDTTRLEAFAESIIGACERLAVWRDEHPEVTPAEATEHLMALISPSLAPED